MIFYIKNKNKEIEGIWFAWYPVCVKETPYYKKIVWLEKVYKRTLISDTNYHQNFYSEINSKLC